MIPLSLSDQVTRASSHVISRTVTLTTRIAGRISRSEYRLVVQKLSELEEEVISQYILDLDSRDFIPRLAGVKDIANYLLETRRAKRVSKL